MVDREDSASLPPADVPQIIDSWTEQVIAGSGAAPTPPLCSDPYPLSRQPCTLVAGHDGSHMFLGKNEKWVAWDPTPPLTEAELVEIEAKYEQAHLWPAWSLVDIPRLIADLRASRERIRELEAKLAWADERIDSGEL